MQLLDLTLHTPQENLALDEALLEQAEFSGDAHRAEMLRLWEPPTPLVVVGRSSQVEAEVNQAVCQQLQIPILRRVSGGAAILAGPGCLMFAVVLSHRLRPELQAIDVAHAFVLDRIARALQPFCPGVSRQGTSDLTWGNRKFSGNSMRVRRDHLLYHGTLLYEFPLTLVEQCLGTPPRQPAYRGSRAHGDFLTNLPLSAKSLRQALVEGWQADAATVDWPRDLVHKLVSQKYSQPQWNLQGKNPRSI